MPRAMRTRYLLGFASTTAILLLVGISIVVATQRFRSDSDSVAQSNEVINRLAYIRTDLVSGVLSQRNYLLTGSKIYRDEYGTTRTKIRARFADLAASTANDTGQAGKVAQLGALVEQRLDTADDGLRIYEQTGLQAAQAFVRANSGNALSQRIRMLMAQLEDGERSVLASRTRASQRSAKLLLGLGLLGIPLSLIIVWAISTLLSREVRERERAQTHATLLNQDLNRTVANLERATSDLSELSRYAGLLQGCRNVPEALDTSRRTLSKLLPESAGTIYLLRASLDYAEAESGWGEHVVPGHPLLAPQECWALRRGQTHCVNDVHSGATCSHLDLPPPATSAATACLPLSAQNLSLGFLYLSAPGPGPIAHIDIAIAAAEQLSLALGNLHLQDTLRQQSIRDALSGLFNRRYLEESLPRELARTERRQLPLALLMCDLDHFKAFNDAHGHEGGDTLLAAFGRLLQANCRAEDIACRYGGEEFVMILPEIGLDCALGRAEKIRTLVAAMTVPHMQRNLGGVTVSIGIALFPQHGSDAEHLKRAADDALYRAKRGGRNRIEVAEPA